MGNVRIESKADLRMVGRAIREGWEYDRKAVVSALMELVNSRDPDLMMEAIAKLQMGDALVIKQQEADIKRELMELKKLGDENALRVRLLEIARHIEPTELARVASENGLFN